MGVWASGIGCCGATSASAIVMQIAHSRTRDRRQGITRERVKPRAGTRAYSTDLSLLCPMADMRSGAVFSRGEISCRINCIEQNVAVIWRRSVAIAALCTPSTEMRTHYSRMSEHYSSWAEAEELGTLAYGR
jgi:hypothetical protein